MSPKESPSPTDLDQVTRTEILYPTILNACQFRLISDGIAHLATKYGNAGLTGRNSRLIRAELDVRGMMDALGIFEGSTSPAYMVLQSTAERALEAAQSTSETAQKEAVMHALDANLLLPFIEELFKTRGLLTDVVPEMTNTGNGKPQEEEFLGER